jgi:Ca2+-binding EF-hand superfamily protein
MIKQLYVQAAENLPEYQQLEDLFKFIDIRKDGQLDFQEFTQAFRSCNPPNLLMGTTPAPSDQIISKKPVDK